MAKFWLLETRQNAAERREAQPTEVHPGCVKEKSEGLSVKKKELEKSPNQG